MAINESAFSLGSIVQVLAIDATKALGAVQRPLYGVTQSDGSLALQVAVVSGGGGGGGGGGPVAPTAAGVSATTANPVQGVTNGVPFAVTGTFWQATQPISIATLPALSAGSAAIGSVTVTSMPTTAVTGTFWQATQPISIATMPALVASTAAIGQVGGKTTTVDVTPTISTSAYVSGYVVGGLLTFSNALLAAGTGIFQSIVIKCKSVQTAGLKLYLFKSNPTNSTWTDHAAAAINVSDIPFLTSVRTLSSPDSGLGTHTIYVDDGIGKVVNPGATTLYGILTTTGTPTFSSTSDLTISIGMLQD